MDTVTSSSITCKIINKSESEDARKMHQRCDYLSSYVRKINVSGFALAISMQ